MGLLKLRVAPVGGGKVGAIEVTTGAAPARARVDRAQRVRKLMLGLAFGTLVLLVALLVTSDSAPRGGGLPPELLALATIEALPGLTWLQLIGASSGVAATWLVVRRFRMLSRRRAFTAAPEDEATQTALVAAWTHKGRLHERDGAEDDVVLAPHTQQVEPVATSYDMADPAAAADFVAWGRQAARSGDQLVAYRLLIQAVRLDPGCEEGWLWLAGTCEHRDETIRCLRRVLAINPENAWARRGLDELQAEDRP